MPYCQLWFTFPSLVRHRLVVGNSSLRGNGAYAPPLDGPSSRLSISGVAPIIGGRPAMRYSLRHSAEARSIGLAAARRLALRVFTSSPSDVDAIFDQETDAFDEKREAAGEHLRLRCGRLHQRFVEECISAFERETRRLKASISFATDVSH
jgi:hypothetical protein